MHSQLSVFLCISVPLPSSACSCSLLSLCILCWACLMHYCMQLLCLLPSCALSGYLLCNLLDAPCSLVLFICKPCCCLLHCHAQPALQTNTPAHPLLQRPTQHPRTAGPLTVSPLTLCRLDEAARSADRHAAASVDRPIGLHWPWWVHAQACFLKGDLQQVQCTPSCCNA